MKKKILTVVGTRPNFIKITQFEKAFQRYTDSLEYYLVHTGQHFDKTMSKVFFEQLHIKEPDHYLHAKGDNPTQQIADIIFKLEQVVSKIKPDLIIVVGDVNSTLAAAICANKMNIKLAHLESGLRSYDRSMPEEENRILTDELTDYYFISEKSGRDNLLKEGKAEDKLFYVGNTMIDTLVAFDDDIAKSSICIDLKINDPYILITMHRPATVDNKEGLEKMIQILKALSKNYTLVFPIHPRTRKNLVKFDLYEVFEEIKNLHIAPPLDYIAFQKLIKNAFLVLTDSGGIQEETTYRKVRCLTLRPNTERPSTIDIGTNELIDFDVQLIQQKLEAIESKTFKSQAAIPELWDGKASFRIAEIISKLDLT